MQATMASTLTDEQSLFENEEYSEFGFLKHSWTHPFEKVLMQNLKLVLVSTDSQCVGIKLVLCIDLLHGQCFVFQVLVVWGKVTWRCSEGHP